MSEKSSMEKLLEFVEKRVVPPLARLAEEKHLLAIRNGMMSATGLIIVGSLFLLLAAMGQPWIGGVGVLLPQLTPYVPYLLLAFQMSMNIVSVWIAFAIGYAYSQIVGVDPLSGGILAEFTFLFLAAPVSAGNIPTSFLGAAGIFTAIIAALFAVKVLNFFIKRGLVIKMPKGVPPAIAEAFLALVPTSVIAVVIILLYVYGVSVPVVVQSIFQPIVVAADNVWAFSLEKFLRTLLWSVGIHGCATVGAITSPFKTAWAVENAEAFALGQPIPHVWTEMLDRIVIWPASIWPIHILALKSKSARIRGVAWAALPADIFTIIEPLLFGLPVALNPIFFIPFVLSATLCSFVTYWLVEFGIAGKTIFTVPWCTPPPVIGFISSGGDIVLTLLPFLNTAIGLLITYPFYRAFEKKVLEEELAEVKAA